MTADRESAEWGVIHRQDSSLQSVVLLFERWFRKPLNQKVYNLERHRDHDSAVSRQIMSEVIN